jgi:hypothetical protein
VLVPGQIPPLGYKCGQATGTNAIAMGLTNGVPYAVGLAAYDDVGNLGPLSPLACQTPVQVNDFFSNYKNDGGQAGNCACSAASESESYGGVLAGALIYSVAAVRRRARGRRR